MRCSLTFGFRSVDRSIIFSFDISDHILIILYTCNIITVPVKCSLSIGFLSSSNGDQSIFFFLTTFLILTQLTRAQIRVGVASSIPVTSHESFYNFSGRAWLYCHTTRIDALLSDLASCAMLWEIIKGYLPLPSYCHNIFACIVTNYLLLLYWIQSFMLDCLCSLSAQYQTPIASL